MNTLESPLLRLLDAVAGNNLDAPVVADSGSFTGEQRTLGTGEAFVNLFHRGVVRVSGPDRLTWLHSLTPKFLDGLEPKAPTAALHTGARHHELEPIAWAMVKRNVLLDAVLQIDGPAPGHQTVVHPEVWLHLRLNLR